MAIRSVLGMSLPRRTFVNSAPQMKINLCISQYYKSTCVSSHANPRVLQTEKHKIPPLKDRAISTSCSRKIKQHFFVLPESILERENQKILGVKPMKFADYVQKRLLSYDEYYNKYCQTYNENEIKKFFESYCIDSYNGYLIGLEFVSPNIL